MKFTIGGESHEMKMDSWQRSNVSPSIELTVERTMTGRSEAMEAGQTDPLVDAAKMMGYFNTAANAWADDVRAALDALGFEIREKNDD